MTTWAYISFILVYTTMIDKSGVEENIIVGTEIMQDDVRIKTKHTPVYNFFNLDNPTRIVIEIVAAHIDDQSHGIILNHKVIGSIAWQQFHKNDSSIAQLILTLKQACDYDVKDEGYSIIVSTNCINPNQQQFLVKNITRLKKNIFFIEIKNYPAYSIRMLENTSQFIVDIEDAMLPKKDMIYAYRSNLLKGLRMGVYGHNKVRVVFDLKYKATQASAKISKDGMVVSLSRESTNNAL